MAQGATAFERDRLARQQAQRERAAASRKAKKEERDRFKSAVQEKAGLQPKQFRSKLKELRVLLPDLTSAELQSSLTTDQLAELCADTAAVARRMVELKTRAPNMDLASFLCSRPAMLTKEQHGSLLLGHKLSVLCVAASADGRLAVTGGCDRTLRVWGLDTCTCLAVLEGHTDWVQAVAVTPDGRRAVSLSHDHSLRVWDLDAYACIAAIASAGSRCAEALALSPDGRYAVVAATEPSRVAVLDLEAQAQVACMKGHNNYVRCVAVSPDGRHILSGSYDATLRVWDLRSMACTAVLQGHTGCVRGAAFTPDGRHAVSASQDETLRLWCLESATCAAVFKGHTHAVVEVAVTHDGRYAVSRSASHDYTAGELRAWDLDSHACIGTISLDQAGAATSLAVLPDGRVVVIGVTDRSLVRILRLPGLT